MTQASHAHDAKVAEKMTRGMLVRRFTAFAASGYGAIVLALFFMQDAMIFPGGGPIHRTPDDMGMQFLTVREEVMGETTVGWYFPFDGARGTVLYSHGNGENLSDGLEQAMLFQSLGLNCLMYDYGGYGDSTGDPSEARCYADGEAMLDWLIQMQGVQPEKLIIAGRSLGGGVATELARKTDPAGVILESTFKSLPSVAQGQFKWLPVTPLVRHSFDNIEKIGEVSAPLLIIHSRDDQLIPFAHGRALYEQANEPKELVALHGGHNDAHIQSRNTYMAALTAFVDRVLGPMGAAAQN